MLTEHSATIPAFRAEIKGVSRPNPAWHRRRQLHRRTDRDLVALAREVGKAATRLEQHHGSSAGNLQPFHQLVESASSSMANDGWKTAGARKKIRIMVLCKCGDTRSSCPAKVVSDGLDAKREPAVCLACGARFSAGQLNQALLAAGADKYKPGKAPKGKGEGKSTKQAPYSAEGKRIQQLEAKILQLEAASTCSQHSAPAATAAVDTADAEANSSAVQQFNATSKMLRAKIKRIEAFTAEFLADVRQDETYKQVLLDEAKAELQAHLKLSRDSKPMDERLRKMASFLQTKELKVQKEAQALEFLTKQQQELDEAKAKQQATAALAQQELLDAQQQSAALEVEAAASLEVEAAKDLTLVAATADAPAWLQSVAQGAGVGKEELSTAFTQAVAQAVAMHKAHLRPPPPCPVAPSAQVANAALPGAALEDDLSDLMPMDEDQVDKEAELLVHKDAPDRVQRLVEARSGIRVAAQGFRKAKTEHFNKSRAEPRR